MPPGTGGCSSAWRCLPPELSPSLGRGRRRQAGPGRHAGLSGPPEACPRVGDCRGQVWWQEPDVGQGADGADRQRDLVRATHTAGTRRLQCPTVNTPQATGLCEPLGRDSAKATLRLQTLVSPRLGPLGRGGPRAFLSTGKFHSEGRRDISSWLLRERGAGAQDTWWREWSAAREEGTHPRRSNPREGKRDVPGARPLVGSPLPAASS